VHGPPPKVIWLTSATPPPIPLPNCSTRRATQSPRSSTTSKTPSSPSEAQSPPDNPHLRPRPAAGITPGVWRYRTLAVVVRLDVATPRACEERQLRRGRREACSRAGTVVNRTPNADYGADARMPKATLVHGQRLFGASYSRLSRFGS
jgi:hypothetical protein